MAENNFPDLNALLDNLFKIRESVNKLEKYAARLLHKRTHYEFARHMQPSDIISDITLKLLSGEINWNPKKSSIIDFFYFRIRTEIFNLVKKERKFIPILLNPSETADDDSFKNDENILVDSRLIVYPFEGEKEEKKIGIKDIQNITPDIFHKSAEEYCVADNMLKGFKNREIAADLGISPNEVHNIKKRVFRKIKSIKSRFTEKDKPSDNSFRNKKPGSSTPELINIGDLK
jgi:RNA polymerase sigma factor (sigma-70 family)